MKYTSYEKLTGWKSIRQNPPTIGENVHIKGNDYTGDWYNTCIVERRGPKKKPYRIPKFRTVDGDIMDAKPDWWLLANQPPTN